RGPERDGRFPGSHGQEFSFRTMFLHIRDMCTKDLQSVLQINRESLYGDLENYAVQNQRAALVCEVNCRPLNPVSMAFHKRLGFKELSQLKARGIVVSLLAKQDLHGNA
ncbi:MAG: hypothetical protein WB783_12970, partial [Arenicellales bacterium]